MTMRIHSGGLGALMASLSLFTPLAANAQAGGEQQVDLRWSRTPGATSCPDQEQVERMVTAQLGRNPFSSSSSHSIRLAISRADNRWVARIDELLGDVLLGSRELPSDAPECASLLDPSVLSIILLIDPLPPDPVPSPTHLAGDERPPESPHPVPGQRALWPRATFHARGGVGLSLLPQPAFGQALSVGVEGKMFEGSGGMLWLPEARTDDGAFAVGLTAGWIGACFHAIRLSRGSLVLCGAALGGAIHAAVLALDDYVPVDPGDHPWAALSLSPLVRISLLGPVSAEIGFDLITPLTRYRLLAGAKAVFVEPPVGVLPFAGLGVSLP